MTRFGKMSRTLLASAALAAASLLPASANAQEIVYNAWCAQYFKNWCAGRWQVENFTSFSECWTYYKELQCRYDW